MINLHFVTTADGSKTIYNPDVGENYHSKHGALQESRHVFLKSGLQFFLEKNDQKHISILEVGFGTGLNFLLSADYCMQNQISLSYTGIEAYPLSLEMISSTEYENFINRNLHKTFLKNYEASLADEVKLNDFCKLNIANCKLEEFTSTDRFDVLYFDAFAALHQPEMWTSQALEHCCAYLNPGGVFVTYAITGNLKRSMKSLGFEIEKAPGAPGKREMLRAIKN
ncbi:tRNA (5-methylaminomethyl-2-thiouridine)(34)-methyltransferase MnmD [Pedobacter sp. P351]|uniref:tRNA (5-methylaminomethyl-2-thiouridine)(34)-methyltransferase MnmD n=1 Tax=Pedobacter superstes TaxID=3133441 RepID=UPI0030B2BE5F